MRPSEIPYPPAYFCVTNIALLLADKTLVNLNFALSRNAVKSLKKYSNFHDKNSLDISKTISGFGKFSLLKLIGEIYVILTKTLAKCSGMATMDSNNEAVFTFSSGTMRKSNFGFLGVSSRPKNIQLCPNLSKGN
jgi:hypothetical protein